MVKLIITYFCKTPSTPPCYDDPSPINTVPENIIKSLYLKNHKVCVQNNILHTLREASYVGEKAFFSLQAPPPLSIFGF